MPLKTDYKNFIPSTTTKIHDIKQASDGTVINAEVILEDVTIYSQEGDAFGSADINATNAQVNANTDAIALKAPLSSPEFTDISTFTGLVDLQGGQIKFPATQVPSADPNTLDDYEEGTWTPILKEGGNVMTVATNIGTYTKIGRLVLITCNIQNITKSGTGDLTVEGIPFVSVSVSSSSIRFRGVNLPSGGQDKIANIVTSTIALISTGSSTSDIPITASDINSSSSADLTFAMSYETT